MKKYSLSIKISKTFFSGDFLLYNFVYEAYFIENVLNNVL